MGFSEDKTQVTFNYFVSSVNLDDTQTCTINKLKINSLALILTSNWVGYQMGIKFITNIISLISCTLLIKCRRFFDWYISL